jgi:hypothetical protein
MNGLRGLLGTALVASVALLVLDTPAEAGGVSVRISAGHGLRAGFGHRGVVRFGRGFGRHPGLFTPRRPALVSRPRVRFHGLLRFGRSAVRPRRFGAGRRFGRRTFGRRMFRRRVFRHRSFGSRRGHRRLRGLRRRRLFHR